MTTITIKVQEETRKKLQFLKINLGAKSYDEVVKKLIDFYEEVKEK